MATKAFLFLVPFLLLLSTVGAALDIIKILSEFPEYSTFSKYLTDTKLADEINSRNTITVLAVDDSSIASLSSLPADTVKKVLAVHVLLDYYDPYKLDKLANKTAILTTLFQASGLATGKAGFVNYTETSKDIMKFGSAEPGAPLIAELIKVIYAKPFSIIVHQVSSVIVPPSIQGSSVSGATLSPVAPTPKNEMPSMPAAEAPKASIPSSSSSSADAPESGVIEPAEGPVTSATEKPASAASRVIAGAMVGLAIGAVAMVAF